MAGSLTLTADAHEALHQAGLLEAIDLHDTAPIFDWLLTAFSYQGVSDQAAETYMALNGRATWSQMETAILTEQAGCCSKLHSFEAYRGCRYDKTSTTCAEPEHIARCPVPRPRLRNGRLNQTAVSFYLFTRDVACGDFVQWIDKKVAECQASSRQLAKANEPLIAPLRNVYGVADKVLTMTLSELLIGGSIIRPDWLGAGTAMVAIDTLVHNFLHRTGILRVGQGAHGYGVGCYAPGGCADVVYAAAERIDAQTFNKLYPSYFPRFVQHAIWRYCAAGGLNICNGNQIDDRLACTNAFCQVGQTCRRLPLKTAVKSAI